jgi:hypothetical protein
MSQYSAAGIPLSPSTGWTNGALNHPQGVAVDQKGNVWIANNYGPESAPGQGNVVVYPGGDPSKAFTISGSGLNHPFAVQIDGYGRAWVTNAGLGGAASASQPGGTPAWGWAAITAAFAVLAAGAVMFFRRRYARS